MSPGAVKLVKDTDTMIEKWRQTSFWLRVSLACNGTLFFINGLFAWADYGRWLAAVSAAACLLNLVLCLWLVPHLRFACKHHRLWKQLRREYLRFDAAQSLPQIQTIADQIEACFTDLIGK